MRTRLTTTTIMILGLTLTAVQAQRPDDRGGRRPGRPAGIGGPPGFLLMEALDGDRDGKLTAAEINSATAALRKLDKNQDGKLSGEEIGWPPNFGGRGRGGFGSGRGGGFPGFGGPDRGRPRRPDPDADAAADGGRAATRSSRPSFFSVEQLQRLDRNTDGTITKDEIPARMQKLILDRVDSNQDGAIDKHELAGLSKKKSSKQP